MISRFLPYIVFILRILLGAVFCFSAIVKLYPIEPFEYTLVDQHLSNWALAPFISRFIIAFEFFLGICLLLGVSRNKWVLKSVLGMLIFFTIYLFVQLYRSGNVDNCGCFGTFLKMTPLESIFKNVVLIALSLFLLKKQATRFAIDKKWLFYGLMPLSLSIPVILNPPDWYFQTLGTTDYKTGAIDFKALPNTFSDGKMHELNQGRVILAFISPTCPHCRIAAMKLSIIKRQHPDYRILSIFYGEEKELPLFVKETNFSLPYVFYNHRFFLQIVDGAVPAVLFLEDGRLIKRADQLSLNGTDVENFFTK